MPKNVIRRVHLQAKCKNREERITGNKRCPLLSEGYPEEEDVMAAMCHSAETYHSIHENR